MVLCFVTVSRCAGSSALRGLTALALGLFFGLIGVDLQTGQARFHFGVLELLDGINVLIVAVGLFAVGETLHLAVQKRQTEDDVISLDGPARMTKEDWKRSWKPWLRAPCLAFRLAPCQLAAPKSRPSCPITPRRSSPSTPKNSGMAPSRASPDRKPRTTPPLPAFSCDADARPADLGHGRDHAFSLPELWHQPRPQLLQSQAQLVWTLIASLYIGNVMLLVLNLPMVGLWVRS